VKTEVKWHMFQIRSPCDGHNSNFFKQDKKPYTRIWGQWVGGGEIGEQREENSHLEDLKRKAVFVRPDNS
jgi:hypothetical protein